MLSTLFQASGVMIRVRPSSCGCCFKLLLLAVFTAEDLYTIVSNLKEDRAMEALEAMDR